MNRLSLLRQVVFLLLFSWSAFASDVLVQDVELFLEPSEQKLDAKVELELNGDGQEWPSVFGLADHAEIRSVSADGQPLPYDFSQGRLRVFFKNVPSKLNVDYSIRYQDAIPDEIVGIEDPSYGIDATIRPEGAYLSANSGWHPTASGFNSLFTVKITGQDGLTGVTSGRMLSHQNKDEQVTVTWQSDMPQQALTLAAGYYQIHQDALDDIQLLIFFSPENSALASGYLESIREYLQLYQTLFGPYPYEKFAVVENFYPTGYGLPGWTLIGNRVIRLPFIRTTSLPHEIAHAWWGNAVEIEYASGNWGEGLATYVADYYLKELSEPDEAIEYRKKILRDYAALVTAENDMALVDFRRRMSKPDQAIGYGKAAMVFHMLREKIGDDAFWSGLQQVAGHGFGKRYDWSELRKHFEESSGDDLQRFFSQWIERNGAPRLSLKDVDVIKVDSGWQVSGNIQQQEPFYELAVPLLLETENRQYRQVVGLYNESECFVFTVADRPVLLSLDPEANLFRQLYPEEIPATINDLRASRAQLVVVARGADDFYRASRDLLRGLQWQNAEVVSEEEYIQNTTGKKDVLFIGAPVNQGLNAELAGIRESAQQQIDDFDMMDTGENVLFMVHKGSPGGPVKAYFLPGTGAAARDVARRIPHYGRYSYLAFKDGRNLLKGTWTPNESPLKVLLDKDR